MSLQPKPVWAGRYMRLDPFRLPQVASYASRDDTGEVTITLDRRGAVVRRTLESSGVAATIMLPARIFHGVAARAIQDDDGEIIVTLELNHGDPVLSVPLLVSDNLYDIAADWRAWSEIFRLPMLIFEADGIARTLEESIGGIGKARPRRNAQSGRRRPRFLMRRQCGDLGIRLVVAGREIIARE